MLSTNVHLTQWYFQNRKYITAILKLRKNQKRIFFLKYTGDKILFDLIKFSRS